MNTFYGFFVNGDLIIKMKNGGYTKFKLLGGCDEKGGQLNEVVEFSDNKFICKDVYNKGGILNGLMYYLGY